MQQPGLQQTPAGWPGMPGLQAPLPGQAPPYLPPFQQAQFQGQGAPFQAPAAPFQSPPGPFQSPAGPFQSPAAPFQAPAAPFQAPAGPFQSPGAPFQPPQAQAPSFQPQYQPQQPPPQFSPQAHQQSAPVAPVLSPTSPYGGGQAPQAAPPNPAQVLARQMVEVARTLEQLIPGFQMMQAVLLEHTLTPAGQSVTGLAEATQALKESLYYHGATLGALRRILCGEGNQAVLTTLAVAIQSLQKAHSRTKPLLEALLTPAPTSVRGAVANLTQTLAASDALLGQASTALQTLIGPQTWEAARTLLAGKNQP